MEQTVSERGPGLPMAAPLRLWKAMGISGVVYIALMLCAVLYARYAIDAFVSKEIYLFLKELGSAPDKIKLILLVAKFLLWLPVIPVVLAALLVPLRVTWVFGRMPLPVAMSETFKAIQVALVMLYIGAKRLIYILVPVGAMLLLYFHLKDAKQSSHFINIYIAVCAVLAVPVFFKALPVILSIPMALMSQCHPMFAMDQSYFIIQGRQAILLLISLLMAIFVWALFEAQIYLPFGTIQQILVSLVLFLAAAYCFTAIAIICMVSITDYTRRIQQ